PPHHAVGPRPELDHAEPLARLQLVAPAHPAHDPAGEDAGDLITVMRARSPSRWSVQRSLTTPASGSNAGTNRPGVLTRSTTRPAIGERFTCTSSGERKMDTRTAAPTHSSTSSTTPVTRQSAVDRTAPAMTGPRRSGSPK